MFSALFTISCRTDLFLPHPVPVWKLLGALWQIAHWFGILRGWPRAPIAAKQLQCNFQQYLLGQIFQTQKIGQALQITVSGRTADSLNDLSCSEENPKKINPTTQYRLVTSVNANDTSALFQSTYKIPLHEECCRSPGACKQELSVISCTEC